MKNIDASKRVIRIQRLLNESGYADMGLASALSALISFKGKLELIQKWQKKLPEPYRTEICNILANGKIKP